MRPSISAQSRGATDTVSNASGSAMPLNPLHRRDDSTARPHSTPYSPEERESIDEKSSVPTVNPSWLSIPNKGQLAILSCSRLVDFWQMASIQSYMIHQLKSFDPSLSEATISRQGGILQGSFTAAQIVTSILWGRIADRPNVGRKNVLLLGLIGTAFSMIGIAFSSSFWEATTWRLLAGAINGTVGAARTMVAENVPKPYHARAFLLLPVAFNVANVFGPIFGGLLVDPVTTFPRAFGPNSVLGGSAGVQWMSSYPYALPNLLCAILLFIEAAVVAVYLKETLKGFQGTSFRWLSVKSISQFISDMRRPGGYRRLSVMDLDNDEDVANKHKSSAETLTEKRRGSLDPTGGRLPFNQIWTSNVIWTLLSIAVFDFHMGAFSSLWITFLSTERRPASTNQAQELSIFRFSGGLAFQPSSIGFALAILGIAGLFLQLTIYPWANGRFGLMRCFRYALFLFPLAYFLAPYISILPSTTQAPEPSAGFLVWFGICIVLFFQVTARTFALPASILLINNCTPHPSVLATIHGIGQSTSSAFRTVGPIAAGYWYGLGLRHDVIPLAWWIIAAISFSGCVISYWVKDGAAPLPQQSPKNDVEGQAETRS